MKQEIKESIRNEYVHGWYLMLPSMLLGVLWKNKLHKMGELMVKKKVE